MRKRTYQKIIIVSEKMGVRLIRFQRERERIENPANAYAGKFLQEKRVPSEYLVVV